MSLIYEPKGRAREYAALACNIYRGCDHGCLYCYAPGVVHVSREQFAKPEQRSRFFDKLEKEALSRKPTDPILLCFTTDPYCNYDVEVAMTRGTIKILHAAGHAVHVLTKGGTRALRDLDLFTPRDAFATTLTCSRWDDSLIWEPKAQTPADRIIALAKFHAAGVPTWVSLEPVLNPADALSLIRVTHSFVDLYKIGRWNYDARANDFDWRQFAQDAVRLCESLGKQYLLKEDLKRCLS